MTPSNKSFKFAATPPDSPTASRLILRSMREQRWSNLFAYGTLMCDDIMREVSGCRLSHVPGTLKGYSRWSVKGEYYPALVPDEEDRVEGVVYRCVPNSGWDRLDRFEGEMYARKLVQIELIDGVTLLAATYVVQPEFLDHLDQSGWDFADFIRNGKASFQMNFKGYQSLRLFNRAGILSEEDMRSPERPEGDHRNHPGGGRGTGGRIEKGPVVRAVDGVV